MFTTRHAASAALLAAAIVASASACGGSSGDPLQGMTSKQVITKAIASTDGAPGVHYSGTINQSGQSMSIDMSLASGKGCLGKISMSKIGSFQIIYNETTVWIKPDKKFWQTQSGGHAGAVEALVGSRYLKVNPNSTKSGSSGLANLTKLCSIKKLFSSGANSKFGKHTNVSVAGQSAVKIADTTDKSYVYVTDTSSPRFLRIAKSGPGGGSVTFTYPSTPPAITTPPPSDSIDGSKLGM